MKKYIFTCCAATLLCVEGYSQTDPNVAALSQVNVSSPNAASLGKFVEFPVGLFNGTPNISIPVYEIKSGDITVPISLGYHSSGVKVPEESSWVGLGWTLNAGGVISRDVKGGDDTYGNTTKMFGSIFLSSGTTTFTNPMPNLNWMFPQSVLYDKNSNPLSYQSTIDLCKAFQANTVDGEPDLYLYNFGAFSGKFINDYPNNTVYDINRNNIKFAFIPLSGTTTGYTLQATTPDGYAYKFSAAEKSAEDLVKTNAYYLTTITGPSGKSVIFSYKTFAQLYTDNGWNSQFETYLTGGTSMTFQGDYVAQLPTLSEQCVRSFTFYMNSNEAEPLPTEESMQNYGTDGLNTAMYVKTQQTFAPYVRALYLDKIKFDDGYVQFISSPRQDLFGVKLDNINVYDNNATLVRSFSLAYDYFIGQTSGGQTDFFGMAPAPDGNQLTYPENYRKKRLKLTGFQNEGTYNFTYYDTTNLSLPYKTSLSQDYWGYYNGAANNTLIPDFRRYSFDGAPLPLSGWTGANREPNETKAIAGMLKTITYPTKGYDKFEYETNRYGNNAGESSSSGVQNVSKLYYATDINQGTTTGVNENNQQTVFTLTTATWVNFSGQLYCNCSANACGLTSSGLLDDSKWDCLYLGYTGCTTCTSNVLYARVMVYNTVTGIYEQAYTSGGATLAWDKNTINTANSGGTFTTGNVLLAAGAYKLVANYPDNKTGSYGSTMSNISASYYASMTATTSTATAFASLGAGLRIKKITKYDPVTNAIMNKSYQYDPGVLASFPRFYFTQAQPVVYMDGNGLGGSIIPLLTMTYNYYLYSAPVVPYSFAANGNLIGYPRVVESFTGGNIGKIEYKYEVTPDLFNWNLKYYIPGIPSSPKLGNGFLTNQIYYNNNGQAVKETRNIQNILGTTTYWSFKHAAELPYLASTAFKCNSSVLNFYPIQVAKTVTQSTQEIDYNTDGTFTTKINTYDYNSQGYLKTQTTTNSDGTQQQTRMAYPPDYTNSPPVWIQSLTGLNMINSPLEALHTANGSLTGGSFVTYEAQVNGIMTPSQVYKVETSVPVPAQNFTSTTVALPPGNTLFQPEQNIQCDTYGNIISTQNNNDIRTSYVWGYANNGHPIAKAVNTATNNIFHTSFEGPSEGNTAGGKTGNYYYAGSYQKILTGLDNGSYVLSYWQLTGGNWVYQSQTVNVTGGTYTISGSNLDEVRFYPANAQMTTYTYNPLTGMTTLTNENNITTYYEYDSYGRLSLVRDHQSNIVKRYSYHYAGN